MYSIVTAYYFYQEHLDSKDKKLKTIAEKFTQDFLSCKFDIENRLNKLLVMNSSEIHRID